MNRLFSACRRSAAVAALLATSIASLGLVPQPALAEGDCPSEYQFSGTEVDYYDPDPTKQRFVRGVESNHLNADVRALRKGQSSYLAGDLVYLLQASPNHPDAMRLLVQLYMRDKQPRPAGTEPLSIECWLARGVSFRPEDGNARLIYGVYLAHLKKRTVAIDQLLEAEKALPDNANVLYNLGLLYFDEKKFDVSLGYAKRAYALGFPLPGLRQKLVSAGQWKD